MNNKALIIMLSVFICMGTIVFAKNKVSKSKKQQLKSEQVILNKKLKVVKKRIANSDKDMLMLNKQTIKNKKQMKIAKQEYNKQLKTLKQNPETLKLIKAKDNAKEALKKATQALKVHCQKLENSSAMIPYKEKIDQVNVQSKYTKRATQNALRNKVSVDPEGKKILDQLANVKSQIDNLKKK